MIMISWDLPVVQKEQTSHPLILYERLCCCYYCCYMHFPILQTFCRSSRRRASLIHSSLFFWSLATTTASTTSSSFASFSLASSATQPQPRQQRQRRSFAARLFGVFSKNDTNSDDKNRPTMKSIVYGPDNQPVWNHEDDDEQPPSSDKKKKDEVLIRVRAVGLNPVDAKGVIGDKLPHSWTTLQSLARRCAVRSKVIGFDFAGVVVLGDDDDGRFTAGDRVYGILPPSRYDGTLRDRIRVSVDQVARVPSDDVNDLTRVAALPLVGITALQCLQGAGWDDDDHQGSPQDDNFPKKKKLLVIGASGGTGHVAVQVGHCLRPHDEIVAVCSTRNVAFVRGLLTRRQEQREDDDEDDTPSLTVLDYRADDFVQQLQDAGPYDVVMDCVTSGDPRDQAKIDYGQLLLRGDGRRRFLTPDAQYRRLGGACADWFRAGWERATGRSPWPDPAAKLFWIQMHQTAPLLERLADWIRRGRMSGAHVAQTVPFTPEGVQQGFDALLERRVVGKVVVEWPEEETQAGEESAVPTSERDKKRS